MRGVQPTPFLTAEPLGKGAHCDCVQAALWLAPCSPGEGTCVCGFSCACVAVGSLCSWEEIIRASFPLLLASSDLIIS